MQACSYLSNYLSIKLINDVEDVLLLPAVAGPILFALLVVRIASLLECFVPSSSSACVLDAPLVGFASLFWHHTFVTRLASITLQVVVLVLEACFTFGQTGTCLQV